MKEDEKDADGTDILHEEQVEVEEASMQGAPVGKLIAYHLVRHEPSQEDAGQEPDNGQEYLSCQEVKPVEQRAPKERQTIDGT